MHSATVRGAWENASVEAAGGVEASRTASCNVRSPGRTVPDLVRGGLDVPVPVPGGPALAAPLPRLFPAVLFVPWGSIRTGESQCQCLVNTAKESNIDSRNITQLIMAGTLKHWTNVLVILISNFCSFKYHWTRPSLSNCLKQRWTVYARQLTSPALQKTVNNTKKTFLSVVGVA